MKYKLISENGRKSKTQINEDLCLSGIKYRITVGTEGKYATLKDAVDWFNVSSR